MASCLVFASGKGTNFKAIHALLEQDAQRAALHSAEQKSASTKEANPVQHKHKILALVCDKPEAGAVLYAREEGIPVVLADYPETGKNGRNAGEESILTGIARFGEPDLLVLAGFMRVLSAHFVERFAGKIINIHPSLLPKYPGTRGIEQSIASDDKELGISIHYVDDGVDTGPIILQRSFQRSPDDSAEEETRKLHVLEHREYPLVVAALLDRAEEQSK